tara:strand:+ start:7895 stop:8047 length:153 start_codon:yes stop_codon:yes gene_type:complete
MGTKFSRLEKINWMRIFKLKILNEADLIKEFCLVHGSTERTAKEILELIR